MNILFITDTYPYPLDSGGKIVTYQIIKMLCSIHKVHLLALNSCIPDDKEIRAISKLGAKIIVVQSQKRCWDYKHSKSDILYMLLGLKPFYLSLFYEKEFEDKLNSLLALYRFDIIHVDHLGMTQYLHSPKKHRWILSEHNVEYKLYDKFWRMPGISLKEKLFNLYNAVTIKKYERETLNILDQIIVLSETDKQQLINLGVKTNKIMISPPIFKNTETGKNKPTNKLLFIGNLWWKPNYDAILWFLKTVLPIIQKQNPNISIIIVGEGCELIPSPYQNQSNIELTGHITNLNTCINQASVLILPFRVGEGIRIKALTAFTHSIPVVSTTGGIQGLDVHPGEHFLLADTPVKFAKQIIKLINSPSLQDNLINNAVQYIKKNHDPNRIKHNFSEEYGKSKN